MDLNFSRFIFPQSFIPLKWFLLHLEPVLHCNLLTNAFKISTKIWGCHVMVPHHFYAKNTFWPLEILSSTPTFPIWSSRHFCTATHLSISLKILPSVWRCQWRHTIHLQAKNPVMFFEKFEWINLFCILVQFDDLYSKLNFLCSSNPELSPTCSPPYQTLKSRRLGSLEILKCMF